MSSSEEAVVAELIQLHLANSSGGWSSPLVQALPLSRLGDMKQEDIAKFIPIRKDLVSSFNHESTATKVYQWIMSYEESKGYLNYSRVNARILVCELLKEWAFEHRHLNDRAVDLHAMLRYKEFASHLLYFHDRWADTEHGATRTKILGQPHGMWRNKNRETLVSTLVKVVEALSKLQATLEKADNSETHCSVYLGQLDELFQNLVDQAASICFLGPSEHDEALTQHHADFGLDVLEKQRRVIQGHNGEVFWSTDWGRLMDAALRQGDPERFHALGAWVIFYQEKGSTCKMYRYYTQAAAEKRLATLRNAAVMLGPGPEYHRTLNKKDFLAQAEPLLEAIDAHLLAIGAKDPEPNEAATDGDLWEFLAPSLPKLELHMLPEDIDFGLSSERDTEGRRQSVSVRTEECESTSSERRRRLSTSSLESVGDSSEGALSQELELVRAKWVARNWSRSGLALSLMEAQGSGDIVNVVLQMAEDLAALLETRRTILLPLEGVCMQLGTLRSRRILHTALARLSLHVDHFVECAQQFHQVFEARLFESLREPRTETSQRPPVQRSYRRALQRAVALRREIFNKVQKLGETVPLQSTEDEQYSFDKLKSSMNALAQALAVPSGYAIADSRPFALVDARPAPKSRRQSKAVVLVD